MKKKTTQEVKQGEYQFGCWSSPFDFEFELEKTRFNCQKMKNIFIQQREYEYTVDLMPQLKGKKLVL